MKFKRIYIEITNQCNLTCDFCAASQRAKRFMSLTEFQRICDQIRFFTDYIYLHVQGEPLLHPHLKEILQIAYNCNLKVQLVTNGTLISENMTVLLDSSLRQISVSLQSLQTISYLEDDERRGTMIKQLLQLADSGKLIQIRLWNYNEQVFTKGVNSCLAFFEIDKKALMIEKKRYSTNHKNIYFSLDRQFQWPSEPIERREVGTCFGTRNMLGILSDGTVVPCCLDHDGAVALGNVFDTPFARLLDNPKLKAMQDGFNNMRIIEPFCQHCQYRTRFDKQVIAK